MRSYMCVCVHACVYVHFAIHPPPQVLMLASLGMPPHNIEKLPTHMIYIGHVQNGAIFVVMHGPLNVYGGRGRKGGGAELG